MPDQKGYSANEWNWPPQIRLLYFKVQGTFKNSTLEWIQYAYFDTMLFV